LRDTSRYYQVTSLLAIVCAVLWVVSLSDNRATYSVSELSEKPWSELDIESSPKTQQASEPPESPSDQNIKTATISRQAVTADLYSSAKVAVWGTIQTEYGDITSFDQIVLYSPSMGKVYTTISNLHGYFYIDDIQPALDYNFRVNPAGMFRQYARKNVDLSAAQTALPVVLQALPLDVLRGRVVNSEGIPVAGIGLRVKSMLKKIWSASFITDSSGSFQVENVPLGGLEFLSTFGSDVLINGHVFEGDSGSPISLLVDQGSHQLNGYIRETVDKPLAGANVTLSWSHGGEDRRSVVKHHTTTDASGYFSISNIGPGQHELQLSTANGVSLRQIVEVVYPVLTITINLDGQAPENAVLRDDYGFFVSG